ncbi:MAG: DUF2079 domain-containing protein [Desulfobulbaceae bacterium]
MDKLQQKNEKYWYIALGLLVAANMLIFAVNALSTHSTLNTFGFDLGIQHQATWLLSRFKNPFVTVNGLHFFAGHSRYISVFAAPFLWIWQDARMMLLLQSFSLSLAAVPLFLIAQKKVGSNFIAIIVVISYFLYPALGHLNMENFHYDSFLVLFFFCAFYFLTTKRYFLYIAFVILALITKEEAAITIFLLGIYVFFQDKNIGVATMLLPAIYVAVLLNLIFPIFIPEGYALYSRLRIGEVFLSDPFSFETYKEMYTILTKNLLTDRNGTYLLQIFYPVAFIPLLSPATMLVAGSLYINLLSDYSYAHSIKYHYVAGFIPFIFISIVYVLSYLTEGKAKKLLLPVIIVIIAASVTGNSVIGSKTRLRDLDEFPKRLKVAMTPQKELEQLIDSVPGDATISATYNIVPHLTDRVTIFQFPNPFKPHYWGLSRKAPYTDVKYVDYVLLDMRRDKDYDEFESLKDEGVYVLSQKKGPFILYKYAEHEDPRNEEAFRAGNQVTLKAKDTSSMELPEDFYSSADGAPFLIETASDANTVAWLRFVDAQETFYGHPYHWLSKGVLSLIIDIKPQKGQALELLWGAKNDHRTATLVVNGKQLALKAGEYKGFRWLRIPLPEFPTAKQYKITIKPDQTPVAFIAEVRLTATKADPGRPDLKIPAYKVSSSTH